MQKYLTQYISGGDMFCSHVYASNWAEAMLICSARGIFEVVLGPVDQDADNTEAKNDLHEACFLSYICLSAGLTAVDNILGDRGIIHEIAHALHGTNPRPKEEIRQKLEWLRKLTPGYLPR